MRRFAGVLLIAALAASTAAATQFDEFLVRKKAGSKLLEVMPSATVTVYSAGATVSAASTGSVVSVYSTANLTASDTVEINGETATIVTVDSSTQITLDASVSVAKGEYVIVTSSPITVYEDDGATTTLSPVVSDGNGRVTFFATVTEFDLRAVSGSTVLYMRNKGGKADPCDDVASAATVDSGSECNTITITGSAEVQTIDTCDATRKGRLLAIICASETPTFKDAVGNIQLSQDFICSADQVLHLVCDGADWLEISSAGGAGSEVNNLESIVPPTIQNEEVFMGTGAGTGAFVDITGDIDINSSGVSAIQPDVITFADISDSSAIDASTTFTAADNIDLTFTTTHSSGNLDFFTLDANQQAGGVNETYKVFKIEMVSEGDAADSMYGVNIVQENSVANTVIDAGIWIDNQETTAATMTDGILITSSGVNNGITDAIDVSAANINNAINIGANNFTTSLGNIVAADFDVIDGAGSYVTGLVGIISNVRTDVDNLAELNQVLGSSVSDGAHVANYITDDADDTMTGKLTIGHSNADSALVINQNSASGNSAALQIQTTQNVDTTDYVPFRVYENSGGTLLAELRSTGEFYAVSFSSAAAPTPTYKLNDSGNAGADDDDKLAASWSANCTQTTEDDEICDFDLNVVMEPTGTLTPVINMDGSAKQLNIGASLPATSAVVIGSSNMGALTVSTNGTGDSEVVLPTGSISGTEVLDESITTADVETELKKDSKCFYLENPVASEQLDAVWRAPYAITITEIWCRVADGTSVLFDFENDNTGVNGSDITCNTSGVSDTTFAGDATVADGGIIDIDVGAVNSSTKVSFCFEYTVD